MKKKKSKKIIINYFGFGTNRDKDMMIHIIGRDDISGVPGQLFGYEMCVQIAKQFREEIPKASPINKSPRDIICDAWGEDFKMYVSRPNSKGVIYGTIWQITAQDLEMINEWEMVEYGAQENTFGLAIDDTGKLIEVITQSFIKSLPEIDKVVIGNDYEPYIASKNKMLKKADEVRENYLAWKNKK